MYLGTGSYNRGRTYEPATRCRAMALRGLPFHSLHLDRRLKDVAETSAQVVAGKKPRAEYSACGD